MYRIKIGANSIYVTAQEYRDLAHALDRRVIGKYLGITIEQVHPNCVKCDGLGHQTGCDRCNNSGVEPIERRASEITDYDVILPLIEGCRFTLEEADEMKTMIDRHTHRTAGLWESMGAATYKLTTDELKKIQNK